MLGIIAKDKMKKIKPIPAKMLNVIPVILSTINHINDNIYNAL